MVEKYISDNQDVHTTINIDNSYFEDGGFFIFFEENNLISEEINYLELENEFKNENIEFKRISLKSKQYECGCGAIFESILYFIASTFVSGILWDGVKKGVCKVKTKFELLDGKSFRKLRKNVSDLTGIEEKLLVVKKFHTMKDEKKIIFEGDNKVINVKTDLNYTILDFEFCNDNLSK